jgi:putative oxidoreductase
MLTTQFRSALAPLVLRLGLAAIVLYHGAVKLAVTGGGIGWDNQLPGAIQAAVAWTELLAGIALVLGLLTRLAAAGLLVIQVGAIILVTGKMGFGFTGQVRPGEGETGFNFKNVGTEYNFAIIVMCVTVILLGAGALAVDHYLWRRKQLAPGRTLQPTA